MNSGEDSGLSASGAGSGHQPPSTAPNSPASLASTAASGTSSASIVHTPTTAAPSVRLTRQLAVGSLVGLIVLGLAWELFLAPLRPGGSWLVLKVLPLCIPLAGLLKNKMYTYRWVSLMVWLYFTEGVVRATTDRWPSAGYAGLQVILCLVLFVACALHVRIRLHLAQKAREAAPAAPDAPPAEPSPR